MFANVVCTEGYQAQLKKAIAEYKSIKDGGTVSIRQPLRQARVLPSTT